MGTCRSSNRASPFLPMSLPKSVPASRRSAYTVCEHRLPLVCLSKAHRTAQRWLVSGSMTIVIDRLVRGVLIGKISVI